MAAFLAVYAAEPYPVRLLRVKVFDLYQQWQPREVTQRPVVIIDLDEQSLSRVGQWPWPRTLLAEMVDRLFEMGAVLVAFDIVFAEPDRMNPADIARSVGGLDDSMRASLRSLPSNDALLARSLDGRRTVIGHAIRLEQSGLAAGAPARKSSVALIRSRGADVEPADWLPGFRDMVRNIPEIEEASAGHGTFTLVPEPDGVVRRIPLLFHYREGSGSFPLFPALSLEMLRVATGAPTIAVRMNDAGVSGVRVGRSAWIPTDNRGRFWPYFSRRDPVKYVSAVDVAEGTVDPERIRGRLAVFGTSAVGLLDIRSTPVEKYLPGVEVHAQIIEAAITGQFLERPNFINAAELGLLLAGGLLMIVLVPLVGARWTMLLFVLVAGGAAATSWMLFTEERVLFDVGYSIAAILLLYTLLTYMAYLSEETQRRQVRSAFGHYLAPAMVEKLAEDPDQLKLGGETREMTLLFCDIRGFTSISEAYKDAPQALTSLINRLLTPLTRVILDHQGTIDKYMGDCIMAFWNAPLDDAHHARHACRAAVRMTEEMEPFNERMAAEAESEGRSTPPLRVGIGINSGDVVVGNMGSDQRFDYSVLGDNVNLASRLEGQCKTYGVDIVVGENTQADVPEMALLELDLIQVKGKEQAVRIFVLLGDESVRNGNAFPVLAEAHGALLDAYRGQRWDEARTHLATCRKLVDGFRLEILYDVYADRIAALEAAPPGAGWDGVFVATSK